MTLRTRMPPAIDTVWIARAVAGAAVASLVLILEIISFVQLIYAEPLPVLTGFLGGVGRLFVRSGLQVGAAPQVDLR